MPVELTADEVASGKFNKKIAHKSCTRILRDGVEVYCFDGATGTKGKKK